MKWAFLWYSDEKLAKKNKLQFFQPHSKHGYTALQLAPGFFGKVLCLLHSCLRVINHISRFSTSPLLRISSPFHQIRAALWLWLGTGCPRRQWSIYNSKLRSSDNSRHIAHVDNMRKSSWKFDRKECRSVWKFTLPSQLLSKLFPLLKMVLNFLNPEEFVRKAAQVELLVWLFSSYHALEHAYCVM